MKFKYTPVLTVFFLLQGGIGYSQCPFGELPVAIDVHTDDYGYDCYWDLTPIGNGCGNGSIFTGGNILEVSCGNGGAAVANVGNGYPDNTVITENIGCLVIDNCFDINFVDDYGDGGTTFMVYVDGVLNSTFITDINTAEASYSFCVSVPPAHNAEMSLTPYEYTAVPLSQITNILVDGTIASMGTNDVTGVTMNVSVFLGPTEVYNQSSAAQVVNSGSNSTFSVPAFVPSGVGTYSITYTAELTELDEDPVNNIATYSVFVTDSVYARDNGINAQSIGIGAGEPGFIGSQFTILDNISVSSISVMIGNEIGDITGNSFNVAVYSTDLAGTPSTLLASAPGVVSSGTNEWHTIKLSPAIDLAPGIYVFTISEESTYVQQLGTSSSVITFGKSFATWTTQPWLSFEDLGSISQSLMIRPNLNDFTGVEASDEVSFLVFPNPSNGIVNIENVQVGSIVELYNSAGQIVYSAIIQDANTQLDFSELSSGIFSLRILSGTESRMTKIVLN